MNYKNIAVLLLTLCAGTACSDNATEEAPPGTQQQDKAAPPEDPGQKLFMAKCSMCHGADGAAGIGNAANLKLSKMDQEAIAKMIGEGKAAMPPFKDQLGIAEIQQIAQYVYTLRQ